MAKNIFNTNLAPKPIGPYNQAVISSGKMIFTSGQIALDPQKGVIVGSDIRTQTRRVLENLKAIVESAGSSLERVVKTTVFLKDMNDFAAMNEIYAEFLSHDSPARSTVEVSRLPKDVLVEIDCIALME